MIRHAEAEGNIYRRAHGQFNGLLIGRAQTQIRQLKERFLNEDIDAVYSSDLLRTCATAAAICEDRGLEIHTTDLLREVNVGEWEDVAWGDIIFNFPEMSDLFGSDPARWSVAGSESYENVRKRMKQCLCDIGRSHDGQTVAAFSHGFAIRALTCELLGVPSHKTNLIPYCDNTAVALLLFENDELTIEFHSDNSHLERGMSTFATQTWWRDEGERKREDLRYAPFESNRDAALLPSRGTVPLLADMRAEEPSPCSETVQTALLDNEPVGFLGLDVEEGCKESIGWISLIYIKPECRRKGFGIQLIGQAISAFRKLNRERLRLEAEPGSALVNFCEKYGFVNIGNSEQLFLMEKIIKNSRRY